MSLLKKLQISELKRSFRGCKLLVTPIKDEINHALKNGYSLRQIYFLMKEENGFPYSYAQFVRSFRELENESSKKEVKEKEVKIEKTEKKPDENLEKKPTKENVRKTWIPDHLKEDQGKNDTPENDSKWVTVNK